MIKTFADNSFIKYDKGRFDDYCIYIEYPNGNKKAPRDTDYFGDLQYLSGKYSSQTIYQEFVALYNQTGKQLSNAVLQNITNISLSKYPQDSLVFDKTFSILYAAMIAEEKVIYTKLGKRIKRLGVHELLINQQSISDSANFMRGKKWQDLDSLCRSYGF